MNKLKPCPFCGSEAKISGDTVECTNILCGVFITSTTPIEDWNTRPQISAISILNIICESSLDKVTCKACFSARKNFCPYMETAQKIANEVNK